MPLAIPAKSEPFRVEITLSIEPERYLRDMAETQFFGIQPFAEGQPRVAISGLSWTASGHRNVEASALGNLADFAARCEAEGAVLGFEMPKEGAALQPFDYMSVDEMSWSGRYRASEENRRSHSWGLTVVKEGEVCVWFEHGKFGMREQTFSTLSAALYCLRDLVDGHPWEDFGDEESRLTLMHKGQFYWDTPLQEEPIPVDNFVFETTDGHRWRIAGSGGRSVLSWTAPNGRRAYQWHDDHAQSLDGLAAILSGEVSPQAFHVEETEEPEFCLGKDETLSPEEAAKHTAWFQAHRWIPETVDALDGAAQGTLFVLDIFESDDKHAVDSLVYLTTQGHKVQLAMDEVSWTVTAYDLDGKAAIMSTSRTDKPAAFRNLAYVLRGRAHQSVTSSAL